MTSAGGRRPHRAAALVALVFIVLGGAALQAGAARAELLVNPAVTAHEGETEAVIGIGFSKVAYRSSGIEDHRDRKFIVLGLCRGLYGAVDGCLSGGFTALNAEDGYEGTGFMAALGLRGDLPFSVGREILFRGYAQALFLPEDYEDREGNRQRSTGQELSLGLAAVHPSDFIDLYAALEVIPYNDGVMTVKSPAGDASRSDSVRDGVFGVRLGGRYLLDGYFLDFTVGLFSEASFVLNTGRRF